MPHSFAWINYKCLNVGGGGGGARKQMFLKGGGVSKCCLLVRGGGGGGREHIRGAEHFSPPPSSVFDVRSLTYK